MALNLSEIRLFENAIIQKGEKWLYSADFNIKQSVKNGVAKLKGTEKIDVEIEDIRHIYENKGIAVILAHKGRFGDGDADHIYAAADYLRTKLGLGDEVKYFEENNTYKAYSFVDSLQPGNIAIMGNTRRHEGEEKNNPVLAQQFADLVIRDGKQGYGAIGGFGKAHRSNASNVGVLEHVIGFMTRSQVREMQQLEPWAGKREALYSVAVLGGVKKEKITDGFVGFADTYDCIIPGGIVLNTIYHVQGRNIGKSVVEDGGKKYEEHVRKVLKSGNASKICIPEEVIVAKPSDGGFSEGIKINIEDGVPAGYMIVDFILPDSALKSLDRLSSEGGRFVMAGTPDIYTEGFTDATDNILEYVKDTENVNAILLGGDTSGEVEFIGPKSTGGGSAISFVAHGTTPVFDALKANKKKFNLN